MFRLGMPAYFKDSREVRMEQIALANTRFQSLRNDLYDRYIRSQIDAYTVCYIKGFGNHPETLSCMTDALIHSRVLIDDVLHQISKQTQNSGQQTSSDFMKFSRALAGGKYDGVKSEALLFIKANYSYVFHIRKIRNEIKNKLHGMDISYRHPHFFAECRVPLDSNDRELVSLLDICNVDEAIKNNGYTITINLDQYLPELLEFWNTVFPLLIIEK